MQDKFYYMTIFRHLNESAARIQRGWRTFVRRREERCKLKEAVYQMRLAYYHQQATLVRTLKQSIAAQLRSVVNYMRGRFQMF